MPGNDYTIKMQTSFYNIKEKKARQYKGEIIASECCLDQKFHIYEAYKGKYWSNLWPITLCYINYGYQNQHVINIKDIEIP